MNQSSVNVERFNVELSSLVSESSKVEKQRDLKKTLIRLSSLQRIIYDEIN